MIGPFEVQWWPGALEDSALRPSALPRRAIRPTAAALAVEGHPGGEADGQRDQSQNEAQRATHGSTLSLRHVPLVDVTVLATHSSCRAVSHCVLRQHG
jgi:hypothetical protein